VDVLAYNRVAIIERELAAMMNFIAGLCSVCSVCFCIVFSVLFSCLLFVLGEPFVADSAGLIVSQQFNLGQGLFTIGDRCVCLFVLFH
jgi:hypothetical protein